jgi:hypothetical protein
MLRVSARYGFMEDVIYVSQGKTRECPYSFYGG